uniref:tRNA-uridine aminocarboxypropyltransferase n=1 Tax=Oceanispirochaeta sp. TaxID=2035350 RepID=UPI00262BEB4A
KEFKRPSNSGNIVVESLGEGRARQILWERNVPDKDLLSTIEAGKSVLLYHDPHIPEERYIDTLSDIEDFLILDGTWQEARKIYNKSPYLQSMKIFSLSSDNESRYNIRRNQKEGGLCTAECVMELLKLKGEDQDAEILNNSFLNFLERMISRVILKK